ncbi:sporulation protein YpjB [Pueribacillus theae]|uniref:Sporulation protein YpjB n=1 Tax=Pueribacillus theae TaxID=2171751 RepID=A0A2U1K4A6_9BACI|nr:sporulation protein YpjB [Pueribacillus theae]PWA12351.1 sporulation protein YpjB [Pueribacillus theae]
MKRILFIFLAIFLLQPHFVFSKENESRDWEATLNQMADQVLQLGKQQKYEEAKKVLINFSPLFLKISAENGLAMKDVKMMIYSYEQAEEALAAVQMDEVKRIEKLTQFRLAVNAVSSEHQPLWKEAENVVMNPLNQAIQSIGAENSNQFQFYLENFLAKYEMIRPSLAIDLPEHDYERLDSYIRYLKNNEGKIVGQNKKKQLLEIHKEFKAIFHEKEQSSADPGLFNVIYTIGGIIAVTLIYVGWRKYKGDKKRKKIKDKH